MNAAASPAQTPAQTYVTSTADRSPQIVDFPAGIPGFEMCRRFVLLTSDELTPLQCLNAVDPPGASFLTIDPRLIDPAYDLTLRDFERARLGATGDALLWLAIVTVTPDGATVNMRAPVVINPVRMVGCQFIRDDSEYPVQFPLGGD